MMAVVSPTGAVRLLVGLLNLEHDTAVLEPSALPLTTATRRPARSAFAQQVDTLGDVIVVVEKAAAAAALRVGAVGAGARRREGRWPPAR
jgi:hypothetical protein